MIRRLKINKFENVVYERKRSWPNLKFIPEVACRGGRRKTMRNLNIAGLWAEI
jgi:hypothetical protein